MGDSARDIDVATPRNRNDPVPFCPQIPKSIAGAIGIDSMGINLMRSGIYFLCLRGEVVYVGQSQKLCSRIGDHCRDSQKEFDSVYVLPVGLRELNEVEAAFIRFLRPSQQGKYVPRSDGAQNHYAPSASIPIQDTLERFGIKAFATPKKGPKKAIENQDLDRALDEKQAAEFLGVSPFTLRKLRCVGAVPGAMSPPPYFKYGGRAVRYSLADLREYRDKFKKG